MKASDVRNWLGIYFLLTIVCLGVYILLFSETKLLPISKKDSTDAFQIIIPVFIAQVTTVFSWFVNATPQAAVEEIASIPSWIVKAPPLLVAGVIAIAIASMIVSEHSGASEGWVDASTFKEMVTFCVTILNATAVLVVTRFFGKAPQPHAVQPNVN